MTITVKSVGEAWQEADRIFPTDYMKDYLASKNAGYDIYYSTADGVNAWISDLGDRLEVNIGAESTNIWIVPETEYAEYQLADALEIISDAIYQIDDKVNSNLEEETGIKEARDKLYGAYAEIRAILDRQYPNSKLYAMYNLQDA